MNSDSNGNGLIAGVAISLFALVLVSCFPTATPVADPEATAADDQAAVPALPTPTKIPAPTSTPTPQFTPTPSPTPTATPAPIPQLELGTWLLPFNIGDTYDPTTRAMGDLSFAGNWVITPFGGFVSNGVLSTGDNPDIWFEVVPGTVLRASITGIATVTKNPPVVTPEGNVFESQDWEIHIEFGDEECGGFSYWLEYDHVVDVLSKTAHRWLQANR